MCAYHTLVIRAYLKDRVIFVTFFIENISILNVSYYALALRAYLEGRLASVAFFVSIF